MYIRIFYLQYYTAQTYHYTFSLYIYTYAICNIFQFTKASMGEKEIFFSHFEQIFDFYAFQPFEPKSFLNTQKETQCSNFNGC